MSSTSIFNSLMNADGITIISTAIVIFAVYYFMYGRFRNSNSLPAPTVVPFFGNYFDCKKNGFQLHKILDGYYKRYGELFSFQYQNKEAIVVSNKDLVQTILVKKFSCFRNRQFFVDMPWPCHDMITMVHGNEKWKYVRGLLTSLMTPKKLEELSPPIVSAAETYCNLVEEAANKENVIDISSHSQGYVMEILLKLAFSQNHPNQSQVNQDIVKLATSFQKTPSLVNSIAHVPYGHKFANHLPFGTGQYLTSMISVALSIVGERKNPSQEFQDILQILLDIQKKSSTKDQLSLKDEDILAQGLVLITAVHSQTTMALTTTMFFLAKHIDVQRKLQKEIDELFDSNVQLSVENLNSKLPYFDKVIDEALRLYPPAYMLMRECTTACQVGDLSLKKGATLIVPLYSINRDEKLCENPDSFNPDRHQSPSDLFCFGMGPRMCVGSRMATTEIKVALCLILRKFNISLQDASQELSVSSHIAVQATMMCEGKINVTVVKR